MSIKCKERTESYKLFKSFNDLSFRMISIKRYLQIHNRTIKSLGFSNYFK